MADAAARILNREIANIGPIDQFVAERAQQKIINAVLRLRRSQTMGIAPSQTFTQGDPTSPFYVAVKK